MLSWGMEALKSSARSNPLPNKAFGPSRLGMGHALAQGNSLEELAPSMDLAALIECAAHMTYSYITRGWHPYR